MLTEKPIEIVSTVGHRLPGAYHYFNRYPISGLFFDSLAHILSGLVFMFFTGSENYYRVKITPNSGCTGSNRAKYKTAVKVTLFDIVFAKIPKYINGTLKIL